MVASKGGISYETALQITRRQARDLYLALGLAHGGTINDEGELEPPKYVQEAAQKQMVDARGGIPGSMRFQL